MAAASNCQELESKRDGDVSMLDRSKVQRSRNSDAMILDVFCEYLFDWPSVFTILIVKAPKMKDRQKKKLS